MDPLTLYRSARQAMEQGRPACMVTIVKTRGSTPRSAGSKMLVYRDGTCLGTIGGGCGEAEARQQALRALDTGQPLYHVINLTSDIAAGEGMACGGYMELFIEPIRTEQPGTSSTR